MIDRHHGLSISKQAKALKISRGSVYYLPRPVSAANLAVMRAYKKVRAGWTSCISNYPSRVVGCYAIS